MSCISLPLLSAAPHVRKNRTQPLKRWINLSFKGSRSTAPLGDVRSEGTMRMAFLVFVWPQLNTDKKTHLGSMLWLLYSISIPVSGFRHVAVEVASYTASHSFRSVSSHHITLLRHIVCAWIFMPVLSRSSSSILGKLHRYFCRFFVVRCSFSILNSYLFFSLFLHFCIKGY